MYYAGIIPEDTANGPGIRVSLFVSGCVNHCKGCFNREMQNPKFGKPFDKKAFEKIIEYMKNPLVCGLTILGGDPCYTRNVDDVLKFILDFKSRMKEENMEDKINIWLYTGYKLETMMAKRSYKRQETRNIIKNVDVVVDGPFMLELKDISLQWRGSSNQRIIDIQKTLEKNNVVLWNDGDYK